MSPILRLNDLLVAGEVGVLSFSIRGKLVENKNVKEQIHVNRCLNKCINRIWDTYNIDLEDLVDFSMTINNW